MSRLELFLPPFLIAFVLTASLILIFLLVPLFRRAAWRNAARHGRKKRSLSRLGGLAMLLAFVATAVTDPHLVLSKELIGLFVGSVFVLGFGLWDDLSELDWRVQMFLQVALAVIIFVFGIRIISIPDLSGGAWFFPVDGMILPSFLLLLAWLLLVMNSMNWLDGLDGLSGGVAAVTLATIFFLSLKPEVNQPPIAILSAIGMGATLGFLLFNAYPARIVAGTAGSMFLGFLITALSVVAGTKIATALLVLALPVADALWVIGERFRAGVSVFRADERHLHYRLRKLGWSEGRIAATFFSVTLAIAPIALFTRSVGKLIAFAAVSAAIFSFLFFVGRKVKRLEIGNHEARSV